MGRRGPQENLYLEALIVNTQVDAWAARGRLLPLTQLPEVIDNVAVLWEPGVSDEEVAEAAKRLAALTGNPARTAQRVAAWRRHAADPEYVNEEKDIQALLAGKGRRILTLLKYQQRAMPLIAALIYRRLRSQGYDVIEALTALAKALAPMKTFAPRVAEEIRVLELQREQEHAAPAPPPPTSPLPPPPPPPPLSPWLSLPTSPPPPPPARPWPPRVRRRLVLQRTRSGRWTIQLQIVDLNPPPWQQRKRKKKQQNQRPLAPEAGPTWRLDGAAAGRSGA